MTLRALRRAALALAVVGLVGAAAAPIALAKRRAPAPHRPGHPPREVRPAQRARGHPHRLTRQRPAGGGQRSGTTSARATRCRRQDRLRAPVRAHAVPGLASTSARIKPLRGAEGHRRHVDRSTAPPTPIAPTTSRWCRRTSSRPRCGSRATAWATCSPLLTLRPASTTRSRWCATSGASATTTWPYGKTRFALYAALYPEGHPYRYLTIGQARGPGLGHPRRRDRNFWQAPGTCRPTPR
jgi:hypothetical protein